MEENDILGRYNLPQKAEMWYYQQDTLRQYNLPQKVELFSFQLNDTLWQYKLPPVNSLKQNPILSDVVENLQDYMILAEMDMKCTAEILKLGILPMISINQDVSVSAKMTKYYNEEGELLFANDDGLSEIIIVYYANIKELENRLNKANANGTIHNSKTNKNEIHSLGRTAYEYSKEATQGMDDYWSMGYKETYGKAYTEGMSQFSWGQILSAIVASIAAENDDGSGQSRHAGRTMGIMEGNRDRENRKINRLDPYSSLKNNKPLIILK